MRVVILGGMGMLGSMLVDVFRRKPEYEVVATVRTEAQQAVCRQAAPDVQWVALDVGARLRVRHLSQLLHDTPWAINAIGVVKPCIDEGDSGSVAAAIEVNALFPHRLAAAAAQVDCRVLQIATDCVYT